jgi:amidase
MTVNMPTPAQLERVARKLGLSLSQTDLDSFLGLLKPQIDAYRAVDQMADELPPVKYPRTPGYRPSGAENPLNAWYYKSTVKGASTGKLAGKTVALKDNVMLAGVPMMNGAATLEGFVPDMDATIVTRLLDAGATILGKAHCESFCLSGGSHTSAAGPVHNPWKRGYSAGGSSSGSAALVAAGEVDLSIGGDQGGSIRIPASFCGTCGMKPTWGLVPYTGIMPIEIFIDHTGPISANVADNALMLEVLAGDDGYDPRIKAPAPAAYSQMLGGGVGGLKIALVKEGFGWPNSEPDVDAKVRSGAKLLERLGAEVTEVSIPMHLAGGAIWTPIGTEGLTQTMMWGDGYGVSRSDLYSTALMDFHRGWRVRADEMSESTKLLTLLGTYINEQFGSRFYGKAVNMSRRLKAAYDAALADHDLLLMPTLPIKASKLPEPGAPREEIIARAFEMIANTAPFDLTHHPAMSIPCGLADGLPVGLMLIGKAFDEAVIYRAAHAFEQAADWKKL